jgi:hypothetical protein
MKKPPRKIVLMLAALAALFLSAPFAQKALIALYGGIGGSLGIRPVTHGCAGLTLSQPTLGFLPHAFYEVTSPLNLRYQVTDDPRSMYCVGQDIWRGE